VDVGVEAGQSEAQEAMVAQGQVFHLPSTANNCVVRLFSFVARLFSPNRGAAELPKRRMPVRVGHLGAWASSGSMTSTSPRDGNTVAQSQVFHLPSTANNCVVRLFSFVARLFFPNRGAAELPKRRMPVRVGHLGAWASSESMTSTSPRDGNTGVLPKPDIAAAVTG
jgi:hypothetical protein